MSLDQMNELKEKHKAMIQNLEERNGKLEREIRTLNDKLLSENNNKLAQYSDIEKKLNDYVENEKILQEQISKTKQSRDMKIMELTRKHNEDLQEMKKKIEEVEKKNKEIERNKTNMLIELENKRLKMTIDKEHLIDQKNEQQQKITKLEKIKDKLTRENEKLKNDIRKQKKQYNNNFGSNFSHIPKFGGTNQSFMNNKSVTHFESRIQPLNSFMPKIENISKNSFLNEGNTSEKSDKEDDILKNLE